jgi:osmotically-inducible protein OsmY
MVRVRGVLLTGLGLGAGLMYLLDPSRGKRRRALIRDQVRHAAEAGREAVGAAARDVENRAGGMVSRVRGLVNPGPVDDGVLIERVRAILGRVVSHPRAIDVDAENGEVILRGSILQSELSRLLNRVRRIRGVNAVISELEAHQSPNHVPSLQGGGERQPRAAWPANLAPSSRLMTGAAGVALTTYGAVRRSVPAALIAAAGMGLIARVATTSQRRRG